MEFGKILNEIHQERERYEPFIRPINMKGSLVIFQFVLLIALISCSSQENLAEIETPAKELEIGSQTKGTISPPPEKLVELARTDLSKRLGVPMNLIHLIRVETILWQDANLGCPETGIHYTQVPTSGFRLILAVADLVYPYHTDTHNNVILCESEIEALPSLPITPGEIKDGKPWMPVQ